MKIIVPNYKIVSRNKIYSSNNWIVRKKIVDEIHEMVSAYIPRPYRLFQKRVNITVEAYYKTKHRRDSSNVPLKEVEDVLKGKVIIDDDYRYVAKVSSQVFVGQKENKVVIKIDAI